MAPESRAGIPIISRPFDLPLAEPFPGVETLGYYHEVPPGFVPRKPAGTLRLTVLAEMYC